MDHGSVAKSLQLTIHKQQLLCYHLLFILTFLVAFVVSVCLKVNSNEICEERLFFIIFEKRDVTSSPHFEA